MKNKKKMTESKERIFSSVDPSLFKKLKLYSSKNGISRSDVIATALTNFFDEESQWDILFKRLNRNQKAYEKLETKFDVLADFMDLFVIHYLKYAPDFNEHQEKERNQRGKIKYEKFIDTLIRKLSNKGNLIEKLNNRREK